MLVDAAQTLSPSHVSVCVPRRWIFSSVCLDCFRSLLYITTAKTDYEIVLISLQDDLVCSFVCTAPWPRLLQPFGSGHHCAQERVGLVCSTMLYHMGMLELLFLAGYSDVARLTSSA